MNRTSQAFQSMVWDYYRLHKRDLPWRISNIDGHFNPYQILVSEMMLQQTQVSRVIPKYHEFLARFTDIETLALAPLAEVVKTWSGLGYNRRAKYLHDAAQAIVREHHSEFPKTLNALTDLPGIGPNTAAAIVVYSYNQPLVFIETNIRSVYIHHFFADSLSISDNQLLPLIAETLDQARPREWYWALMDYGSHLKATSGNASQRSRHYKKQSAFQGSMRQLRGRILRELAHDAASQRQIIAQLADPRTPEALASLVHDGLIQKAGQDYRLTQ